VQDVKRGRIWREFAGQSIVTIYTIGRLLNLVAPVVGNMKAAAVSVQLYAVLSKRIGPGYCLAYSAGKGSVVGAVTLDQLAACVFADFSKASTAQLLCLHASSGVCGRNMRQGCRCILQ
jgi:hypothetical protein